MVESIVGVDRLFIAPEILQSSNNGENDKACVYSVGAILYMLVCGGVQS